MSAGEQGADYVAFGAFFPSTTKTPPAMAEAEILTWWSELMEVPCVAIGGITPQNCRPLVECRGQFRGRVGGCVGRPGSHGEGVRRGAEVAMLSLSLRGGEGRRRVPRDGRSVCCDPSSRPSPTRGEGVATRVVPARRPVRGCRATRGQREDPMTDKAMAAQMADKEGLHRGARPERRIDARRTARLRRARDGLSR